LVDRVLSADVTLETYSGGVAPSVASWARTSFDLTLDRSAHALELVLHPRHHTPPLGLLEKRIAFDQSGLLTVSYRWDPALFPSESFFCPEISATRTLDLDLAPRAEVWSFPFVTLSRSERGFEETVQGHSHTPRWPIRVAEARLTLRVPHEHPG
jgi:hypothetical protein